MSFPAPRASVTVGGIGVPAVKVVVTNHVTARSAQATVTLDEDVGALNLPGGRQDVVIKLNDQADVLQDALTGWTSSTEPALTPWYERSFVAVGRKALLGRGLARGVSFGGASGIALRDLVVAVAELAGLSSGQYDIDASVYAHLTLKARREVLARKRGSLAAFWQRLEKVCNAWSADQRDGTVKFAPWGMSGLPTLALTRSVLMAPLRWPQDLEAAKNGVQVLGYVYPPRSKNLAGGTNPVNRAYYALVDASAGWPLGGGSEPDWDTIDDPLIELVAHATALCADRFARVNKVANTLSAIVVGGDPTVNVGAWGNVVASQIGLDTEPAVVLGLQHDWDLGAVTSTTNLTLEALTGEAGSAVGLAPQFSLGVTGAGTNAVVVTVAPITSDVSDGPFRIAASNTGDGQEVTGSSDPADPNYAGVFTFGFPDEVAAMSKSVIVEVTDPELQITTVLQAAA